LRLYNGDEQDDSNELARTRQEDADTRFEIYAFAAMDEHSRVRKAAFRADIWTLDLP
jgi:hypothetical protein